ncbi:enoyl-ACP reductase FabI [Sporosarcina pasteurii]|uniref:Enoyl-[acyl-carrier-protein] reductase [NADH] n=1 Tax=Sporosarcina pasteurii TaxID=1474 RepID=A0A380BQS7_SPOPA|nr:enoyl-ACP reductase FabI [Sporosarcina pasteurii]MDS9471172.1 enoyl-ACP reductase FabI [Sporosarcina pasteurii]QBQ05189.1 enoyl-ACP reductase FabI [Sporosarcina pasteurii]SUJ05410.1 Enoyl-[acyl-carrier-protein] reductase [NADH] FabI [Sporosarcina pasteurii]
MNNLLTGKNFIIMGVANKRSIAWGIAKALNEAGANLIFTYQGERLKREVERLIPELNQENTLLVECDVTSDESIDNAFGTIAQQYPVVDGLAHCIAFAKREELTGDFSDTSRDGFQLAHDISAFSLVAVSKAVKPLLKEGGSILTLTYLGGERVVKNYNIMGVAKASLDASVKYLANDFGQYNIRVNSISAGPIRTLAAKGIAGFNENLKVIEEKAPLRRTTNPEEVGKAAIFLLSDLASGVTGENLHVDSGYHIIGY